MPDDCDRIFSYFSESFRVSETIHFDFDVLDFSSRC